MVPVPEVQRNFIRKKWNGLVMFGKQEEWLLWKSVIDMACGFNRKFISSGNLNGYDFGMYLEQYITARDNGIGVVEMAWDCLLCILSDIEMMGKNWHELAANIKQEIDVIEWIYGKD